VYLAADEGAKKLSFEAPDWSFQPMKDQPRAFWAATPTKDATIAPKGAITIAVTGLQPATGIVQAQIYFDYYDLDA
jgi:hypothetical protein